jgi:hypothetical protein
VGGHRYSPGSHWKILDNTRLDDACVVRTDHNNLRYFLEQRYLSERQQKWVINLHASEFDIEYVKGKKNVVVDSLSKRLAAFSMTDISTD